MMFIQLLFLRNVKNMMTLFLPLTMKVRYAVQRDAEAIANNNLLLARESEDTNLRFDTVLAGVKAVLSDKEKGFYMIAEENDEIIGQMMITYEWSDWRNKTIWWLQSVYVAEAWRKKGVYTQLLQEIKKRARKQNVEILRLYVHTSNDTATKVYQRTEMKKAPYTLYQLTL